MTDAHVFRIFGFYVNASGFVNVQAAGHGSRWARLRSHALKFYMLTVNVLMLGVMPLWSWYNWQLGLDDQTNPLTRYCFKIGNLYSVGGTLFLVCLRRWRQQDLQEFRAQFEQYDRDFFRAFQSLQRLSDEEHKADKYLSGLMLAKGILLLSYTMVGTLPTLYVTVLSSHQQGRWSVAIFAVYALLMNTMFASTMVPFFMTLHGILRRLIQLNQQLKLHIGGAFHLCSVHIRRMQLRAMMLQLCSSYKWYLVFVRCMYFMTCVTNAIIVLVILEKQIQLFPISNLLLTCLVYALILLHLFLIDLLCEMPANCSRRTVDLLSNYSDNGNRVCVNFCTLQTACWNWEIRYFRVFPLNREQTFGVISYILLYTIFLVQWDYKNIYN